MVTACLAEVGCSTRGPALTPATLFAGHRGRCSKCGVLGAHNTHRVIPLCLLWGTRLRSHGSRMGALRLRTPLRRSRQSGWKLPNIPGGGLVARIYTAHAVHKATTVVALAVRLSAAAGGGGDPQEPSAADSSTELVLLSVADPGPDPFTDSTAADPVRLRTSPTDVLPASPPHPPRGPPLEVVLAAMETTEGSIATDLHRIGKPLEEPYDGCHSTRRGTYRAWSPACLRSAPSAAHADPPPAEPESRFDQARVRRLRQPR
jgi:hypothetical protein